MIVEKINYKEKEEKKDRDSNYKEKDSKNRDYLSDYKSKEKDKYKEKERSRDKEYERDKERERRSKDREHHYHRHSRHSHDKYKDRERGYRDQRDNYNRSDKHSKYKEPKSGYSSSSKFNKIKNRSSSSSSNSASSNSKSSSKSSQKKEDSQKNNNMQQNLTPIISDSNRKIPFVPPINPLLNPAQLKYIQQYNTVPAPLTQVTFPNTQSEAQDKILKDQNFLSSDDKLYEGIIHHGLNLKNIFAECQFSEKLLGSKIYRAIKKLVYDPNTIIFEEEQNSNTLKNNNESDNFGIKEIEIVESLINDIIQDTEIVPKIPDTSSIFEKVMKMKEEKGQMIFDN